MKSVTVHVAETTLSKLLAVVDAGEEIVLARGRRPVAKLVPFRAPEGSRVFGAMRGRVTVGPEFFDELPDEELAGCE